MNWLKKTIKLKYVKNMKMLKRNYDSFIILELLKKLIIEV